MQPASQERPTQEGFQPLGVAIFFFAFGAVPLIVLWLVGAPIWVWPLPFVVGLFLLLILGTRAKARPPVAGFQRAAGGLLVREWDTGSAPQWREIPHDQVFGFVVERGEERETIAVFYEESEERPVAQRFAPADGEDEELVGWLAENYKKLEPRFLKEDQNLRRVTERAKARGWNKELMVLPEDVRARLRRICETLLQLPIHTEVRYHTELIEQYLPQLGNLLAMMRKWVILKRTGQKPSTGGEEDNLVLETFLTSARVIARIRDQEDPPEERYQKWDLHFRPICLAIAQAAGSQVTASAEPPIILGPTPEEKSESAPAGKPGPAKASSPKEVPTDALIRTPPFATPPEPAATPSKDDRDLDKTVIEPSLQIQMDDSWPNPIKDFVREIPTTPWLMAKEIPSEARGLLVEHLRRLQPFSGEGVPYTEAFASAKKASFDLKEWAGWDPTEDDTWWIQFHLVRKRFDARFGEAKAGQLYSSLKELCELHLLWESAQPPPAEPNPWAPLLQLYRLGLSVSFEDVPPFGTVLEVPSPEPGKARNLEVVLPKK